MDIPGTRALAPASEKGKVTVPTGKGAYPCQRAARMAHIPGLFEAHGENANQPGRMPYAGRHPSPPCGATGEQGDGTKPSRSCCDGGSMG